MNQEKMQKSDWASVAKILEAVAQGEVTGFHKSLARDLAWKIKEEHDVMARIAQKIDLIAAEIEKEDPRIALALDRISDKLS
jgi:hypothetical protein